MSMRRALGCCLVVLLTAVNVGAASSDVADAAMKGNRDAVRALLQRKADVNVPQIDGTTALHWAVRVDDLELAEMLIIAGANVSAATREGVMPLQLAAMNGNAAMLGKLIKAGADPNAPLTQYGDTALMMAARTGKTDAITVLLETGAQGQREGDMGRDDGVDVGRVRGDIRRLSRCCSTTARTRTRDPISSPQRTAAVLKDARLSLPSLAQPWKSSRAVR